MTQPPPLPPVGSTVLWLWSALLACVQCWLLYAVATFCARTPYNPFDVSEVRMGHALGLWFVFVLLILQSVTATPFLIRQNRHRGHRINDLRHINGYWSIIVGPLFMAILWILFPRKMLWLLGW